MADFIINIANNPLDGEVVEFTFQRTAPDVTFNGFDLVYRNAPTLSNEVQIGASVFESILNLKNFLESSVASINFIITTIGKSIIFTSKPGFSHILLTSTDTPNITYSTEIPALTKIFVRSPYKIIINQLGQTASLIEVYAWNEGTIEPTIPQWVANKVALSLSQTLNQYNISEYAKEYIENISPINAIGVESTTNWCYLRVKTFATINDVEIQVDDLLFVCLYGYNDYLLGYNQTNNNKQILLSDNTNRQIDVNQPMYVNYWLDAGDYTINDAPFTAFQNGIYSFIAQGTELCEPIYDVVVCQFINRFGGWETLHFFKNSTYTNSAENEKYNLLPDNYNYNPLRPQKQIFNTKGKRTLRVNTGFVNESFKEVLTQLLFSETILVDNKPAILTTQSIEEKTRVRDRNINYELEFEFAYNQINDAL